VAETVSGLVSAIVDEASFDVTSAQALAWLNRRWRSMLGRARAYDAVFDAACGEFLRITKRRFRGPGPTGLRVEGAGAA
jgi:hypothetical protein